MFFCRTKGPQVSLVSICAERWTRTLRSALKKSLTLCIAHYLNTKQNSGWVVTLAGYDPAKLRLERAVTLPIRPQGQIRVAKG